MTLPVNNAVPPGRTDSAVMPGNRPAVLLSPLEVQTDILRLPPLPRKQREKAVRRELRSLYPGNAETACVEFFPLPRNRKDPAGRMRPLAVFTAEPETGLRYREKQGPVIPGLAFLLAGGRYAGKDSDLALLLTPEWIEAASFTGGEVADYSAAGRKSSGPPPEFLEGLRPKTETEQQQVTIILKDTDETDDYVQSLKRRFTDHRIIGIGDLRDKINIRKYAVFRRKKTKAPLLTKKAAAFLLALYGIFLFISLELVAAKAENSAALLKQRYDERKARHDESERLLAEIEALENPGPASGQDKAGFPDPYTVIAEINRRVRGAHFHSIIIQGERFSFEAEAPDALGLLRELERSPYFAGIVLHQTAPLSADSELFSISGSIQHE
ncbi:MAG: hypothetical protein LBI91_01415 [Spirochaetaceae bacterium]|jgi:hypothetical protein|nr:hypothetical protein [Spirochaetaceae bacterium]